MAVHPTTKVLYGVTGGRDPTNPAWLITIDKTTDAGTLVGAGLDPGSAGGPNSAVADITFTSDGTLYGWFQGTFDLVTIDITTGAGTIVGDSTLIATAGSGIAASPGDVLFFTGEGSHGALHTVDRTTGLPAIVGTLSGSGGTAINALAFNGTTLFGSHFIGLVRVDHHRYRYGGDTVVDPVST